MSTEGSREEPPSHVVELYKLTVEMADRVSGRRAAANSFFLALQTGLAAGLGLFSTRLTPDGVEAEPDPVVLTLAAAAGAVLAAAWWLLLRSYRDLNRAKFEVINTIERDYFEVKPFTNEWEYLRRDPIKRFRGRYTELGAIEKVIPVAFAGIYLILAFYVWAR